MPVLGPRAPCDARAAVGVQIARPAVARAVPGQIRVPLDYVCCQPALHGAHGARVVPGVDAFPVALAAALDHFDRVLRGWLLVPLDPARSHLSSSAMVCH
jgi:hypothetical protein